MIRMRYSNPRQAFQHIYHIHKSKLRFYSHQKLKRRSRLLRRIITMLNSSKNITKKFRRPSLNLKLLISIKN